MISVLLLSLLVKFEELLTIRIVPDTQLEALLIHVNIVKVQVAALHEVGEDFLNHLHADRLTFYREVLCKVKVAEVYSWGQKLALIKDW